MNTKKVLLVSSSQTIISLIKTFIDTQEGCAFVPIQTEGTLMKHLAEYRPEFVFIESNFWGHATPFFLTELVWKFKRLKIAVFNFEHTPAAFAARFLLSGASSYVDIRAAPAEVCAAFHTILDGGTFAPDYVTAAHTHIDVLPPSRKLLTPKEMKILLLFARGCRCREVAGILNRTEQSIRNAKTTVYRKCGVTNERELIAYALAAKLINENELWSFHRPRGGTAESAEGTC